MKKITNEDKKFLWSLLPDWVVKMEPGLCPTMYGTGSYEGDCDIHKEVVDILGDKNDFSNE